MKIVNSAVKDPIIQLTMSELDKIKSDTTEDAVEKVLLLTLGLPVMVLKDKYNHRKQWLEKFVNELLTQYNFVEDGTITLDDVRKVLWDEVGIRINREEK